MTDAAKPVPEPSTWSWRLMAQIGAGFAAVWICALIAQPYLGNVPLWVAAGLTVVALALGLYLWRLSRRTRALSDILQRAVDPAQRDAALRELEAKDKGAKQPDAMNALARAQILAQSDPVAAMALLESIEIDKAPALMRDDIRTNLALMYLSANRAKDARIVVEKIKLNRQGAPAAKAMSAAVVAEAFARTGSPKEAEKVILPFNEEDASLAQAKVLVLRAKLFCDLATGQRKRAERWLGKLADEQPQMVLSFMQRGARPELMQLARQVAQKRRLLPQQVARSTRHLRQ